MEQNFDKFAKKYRQIHTENVKRIAGADSYYFAHYKVKELARFEENNSQKLLDLGCGDGATEFYLSSIFSSFSVTGIDISSESIRIAKDRKLPKCNFLLFDGSTIPFHENSFDIVFIAGVFHHVPPELRQNLMGEAARVLKPGGRLYLFEHNPYNPLTRYLVNTCVFDEGVQLLKAKESRMLLSKAGLKILARRYVIFFPRGQVFGLLHKIEPMMSHIPFGGQYYFRAIK